MRKIKEFEINISLKNNLLKERRLKLGLTQKQIVQSTGESSYPEMEGLRVSPIRKLPICRLPDCDRKAAPSKGYLCWKHVVSEAVTGMDFPPKTGWKQSAMALADYFGCQPSDLFPDVILEVITPRSSMKLDEEQVGRMRQLLRDSVVEPPRLISPVEEEVMKKEEILQLEGFIGMLKPAYQRVLRKHWGLGCDPLTFAEIGKPMRLSRERIRQIELEAIGILRKIYAKTLLREHPVEDLTQE